VRYFFSDNLLLIRKQDFCLTLYTVQSAYLVVARHVKKFREANPTGPKVITVNTLNFKPIFECSFLQIVGGPPSQVGRGLASLGHSLARVKI